MRQTFKSYTALIASICVVVWANAANSQIAWPTMADVQQRGASLSQHELADILSEGAALLSPGLGVEGPAAIFHCNGENSPILSFVPVSEGLQTGMCSAEDSSICLALPSTHGDTCFGIRRMPESETAYFAFIEARDDDPTALGVRELSAQPAMSFAVLSTDVYELVAGSGELELGRVSLTMSVNSEFTLVHASNFPLRFIFEGQADHQPLILFIDQVGWPDQDTTTDDILEQPLLRQPQLDFLRSWEQIYEYRDLRDWGYPAGFATTGYRSRELDLDQSPCIQTHESIVGVEGAAPSGKTYVAEHVSQQVCISLNAGAFVSVTAKFIEPFEINGEQAEAHATTIFATLELLSASEGDVFDEMTFQAFQEMQGGDPDLTWELLDCVQGWSRAAQVNGCNHAIRRFVGVIDAGEWLLASEALTNEERTNVEEAIQHSRSSLPIVYFARAGLLQGESPQQTREDCRAARAVAAELAKKELIDLVDECPSVR